MEQPTAFLLAASSQARYRARNVAATADVGRHGPRLPSALDAGFPRCGRPFFNIAAGTVAGTMATHQGCALSCGPPTLDKVAVSGFFIRQGSTCWPLQLHPENAQTNKVDLALAFGWVQFIADKLTACHGLQKNPVQCNTVNKRGGHVASNQRRGRYRRRRNGNPHPQLTERVTGKIYMERMRLRKSSLVVPWSSA